MALSKDTIEIRRKANNQLMYAPIVGIILLSLLPNSYTLFVVVDWGVTILVPNNNLPTDDLSQLTFPFRLLGESDYWIDGIGIAES